jgi:hypothetical protein
MIFGKVFQEFMSGEASLWRVVTPTCSGGRDPVAYARNHDGFVPPKPKTGQLDEASVAPPPDLL